MSAAGELMRAEIAEQPDRWLTLLRDGRDAIDRAASLIRASDPGILVFAARGSSDHAAMYGQYLGQRLLGIPAMLATPATFTMYGAKLRYPRSAMIALSQSGESPDLLATVQDARRGSVPVIAVTNDAGSALAGLGDVHVDILAGPERSVAATKTYTGELLALYLTLSRAAGTGWHDLEERSVHAAAVAADVIAGGEAAALTDALGDAERVLVVGRGYSMATAREGALKLMETSAVAASGWSAADATHGPLGQVVPGTVVVALRSGGESVSSFAAAAESRGGRVVTTAAVTVTDDALVPPVEIVPLQQAALEVALRRDHDPDHPAGLAKVTRTV
ncbi:MAG: SIS domain-containing protein [Microbacterium sp.]